MLMKRKAWNRVDIDITILKELYANKKFTGSQIAKEFGVSQSVIYNRLRELKLTRSNSESHMGIRPSNYQGWHIEKRTGYKLIAIGKDHPFYEMGLKNKHNGCRNIREHRLVMAEHLGRPLKRHEVVHHINGDKLDNRIDNLELIHGQAHHHGHTIAQIEFDKLYEIIKNCPSCKAALAAVNQGA